MILRTLFINGNYMVSTKKNCQSNPIYTSSSSPQLPSLFFCRQHQNKPPVLIEQQYRVSGCCHLNFSRFRETVFSNLMYMLNLSWTRLVRSGNFTFLAHAMYKRVVGHDDKLIPLKIMTARKSNDCSINYTLHNPCIVT